MGSIGVPELIMIFVVALVLFGPKKLPEIGRTIGKAMGEFRRATNDLQRSLEEEVAASDLREVGRDVRDIGQSLKDAARVDLGVLGSVLPEPVAPTPKPAEAPVGPTAEPAGEPASAAGEETVAPDPGQPTPLEPN